MSRWRSLVGFSCFLLAACGGRDAEEKEELDNMMASIDVMDNVSAITEEPPAVARPNLSKADRGRLCRQIVAELNGQSERIVKVTQDDGEITRVTYKRPSDGSRWTNECKFGPTGVVWRTVEAFGAGSGLGRWRGGGYDERIVYETNGDRTNVKIIY